MKTRETTYKIVFVGVMSALVCAVTIFRFPLLGSYVHFANALCLLSGMLFGPVLGGLSAGLGSGIYDITIGGYDIIDTAITFVSKGLMGFICGLIAHSGKNRADSHVKNIVACVVGALSYVFLYMLRTLVYQRFVYGLPWEGVFAAMGMRISASLINAGFAMVVAPALNAAIRPTLKKAGVLSKIFNES